MLDTYRKAFSTLEDMALISRRRDGHRVILTPLREDASGNPWIKAGSDAQERDGYFVVPHEYWTHGYADRLRLPGKAMLLIALKETQGDGHQSFEMAVDRAFEWYGISERTAERGFNELNHEHLLLTRIQRVANPKLPPGVYQRRYHRAPRATRTVQHHRSKKTARCREDTRHCDHGEEVSTMLEPHRRNPTKWVIVAAFAQVVRAAAEIVRLLLNSHF